MFYACFYLCFGISHSWDSSSFRCLPFVNSCDYRNNVSVCWWCAHPYRNSPLGWWYCVGSGSSLYQLYNIITQGYCNEIPSIRKRALEYFPASEHRLFLLSELWIEFYVLILWNHLPFPIQGQSVLGIMVTEVGYDDMNAIKCSYVQYSFVSIPWHACLLVKHCQFQCCERGRSINDECGWKCETSHNYHPFCLPLQE